MFSNLRLPNNYADMDSKEIQYDGGDGKAAGGAILIAIGALLCGGAFTCLMELETAIEALGFVIGMPAGIACIAIGNNLIEDSANQC